MACTIFISWLLAALPLAQVQPVSVAAPPLGAQGETQSERPNIIVFLVDDLGWQDTAVASWVDPKTGAELRTAFNDLYQTPTLQILAEQGVRFTQAYACAVCSPTRTSIMTGQNAARHHVTQWTLRPGKDPSGKTPRLQSPAAWRINGIQPDDFSAQSLQTLPTLLRQAGYHTIHVGKAHWGVVDSPGADPTNLGFDVNIAGHHAGAPSSYQGEQAYGHYRKNQEIWAVPGLEAYHGLPVHLSDALTIEANQAITAAVNDRKPFFLYMAHYAVHAPLQPHHPHMQKYLDQGLDEAEAKYASMIEGIDHSMTSLLRTVEALGQSERTIVMFCSDNGGLSVHARGKTPMGSGQNTHNLPLRAGKGSAYEGGTRIPQWISWAKVNRAHPMQKKVPVASGAVRHEMTIVEDYYPTILTWAGVQPPDWLATAAAHADEEGNVDPMLLQDGKNFTELLQPRAGEVGYGESPPVNPLMVKGLWQRRPLIFHYPHVWGPNSPGWGYEPHSAMRLGDWKVIYFYQPQRWELYHLPDDIGEQTNLAAKEQDKLRQMASRMIAELVERGAQWPLHRELQLPEPPVFVDATLSHAGADGAPLILIHGWGGDRHSFDAMLPYLGKERPLLALDLPGHGRSIAPIDGNGNGAHTMTGYARSIAAKMDEVGISAGVLIGHSNGAPIAREFARLYPKRALGIVSLDGSLVKIMGKDAADQFAGALTAGNSADFLSGVMDGSLPNDIADEHRARLTRTTLKTDVAILVASMRAVLNDQPWPQVNLQMPVLALHVEAPFWTDAYLNNVRAMGARVEVDIWPGLSHYFHFQVPERVAERLEQWMQKHQIDQQVEK
ncbi:MAG: alpha/beta fold hydrolase [Planctomycetes bacterium]|nr:alpha/beta fold hydrolase [Planctomycetota bacterium]